MPLHISPAQASDVDACARILADAFLDDGVLGLIIRGDEQRHERLQELFAAMMVASSVPAGTVDVARRDPGGEIVGLADWHGPDATRGARTRSVLQLPRKLRAVGVRNLVPVARTTAKFKPFTPHYPHWYLAHIAVGSGAQGLGVGSQLLAHRLSLVDGTGLPSFLESTSAASRRLYERYGFHPIGSIVLSPDVTATPMLRPVHLRDDAR